MFGLNLSDYDLFQLVIKRLSCILVNEIYEFECKDFI